jgi:hypothetical protein
MAKYVDASPFELLEGRLLPSDSKILACLCQLAEICIQRPEYPSANQPAPCARFTNRASFLSKHLRDRFCRFDIHASQGPGVPLMSSFGSVSE